MRIMKPTLIAIAIFTAQQGLAAVPVDSGPLRTAVTPEGVLSHLSILQDIAAANDGNRGAATPGYDASLEYIATAMRDAGYLVSVEPFDFPYFEELSPPVLDGYGPDDFLTMNYSGSGDVTAPVVGVDLQEPPGAEANSSTSGCEAEDFAGFPAGGIALIQRGSCSFQQKAQNAEAAGAAGVVIYNEGQEGRTDAINGTLGEPGVTIPVVGAAYGVGLDLMGVAAPVQLRVDAVAEIRTTANLIAETPAGRGDRVVVVGAHLDSVPEGPGINDNGSGSATILELALQLAGLGVEPRNKVRFAWWGAEESGLLGSYAYVEGLDERARKDIALNLNFDMVGSPNYVSFVYDGDGSATETAGPNGSGNIERVFLDYFADQGLPTDPTAFDGRSDYGPFIEVGIPAGGLFTGAEGVKTDEQAALYGGSAGDAYDPCYHATCDDYDNLSVEALDLMSDAAAHAVYTFAMTTSAVNGTDKGSEKAAKTAEAFEYRGNRLRR